MEKVKPQKDLNSDLRMQKLENDLKVAFLAISQLKSELDKMNLMLGEGKQVEANIENLEQFSEAKAKKMIKTYISKNPGCLTSDVICDLKIHPDVAWKVLRKLRQENKVRSEDIGKNK